MKKTLPFFAVMLLLLAASCGSKKPADLVMGKWQATKIEAGAEGKKAQDEAKKALDSMPPELKAMADSNMAKAQQESDQKMADLAKSVTMEFKSGGAVTLGSEGKVNEATYTMSEDGKTINIDEAGDKMDYKVITLTDKDMVLDMGGMMTIYLTKQ